MRYLRSGSALAVTGARVHDVLSSGRELIGALELHTDGEWFWYSDLAHYVERHVPLDEAFVDHARAQHWAPPNLSTEDLIRMGDILDALFDAEESGMHTT
ncbi:hypothetical protein AB0K74_44640 [Streptomyces sp. NPDC056159]|uniref:hypothetical protein n=1 Tax=Streptomyces sp. NPDC056159 TaxID=3155537 RepID=UPI00342A68A2